MAKNVDYLNLEEKAKKSHADAVAVQDAAIKAGRNGADLTAEEKAAIDKHFAEYDSAKADLDRLHRLDIGPVLGVDDPVLRKAGTKTQDADDPKAVAKKLYDAAFAKALHRTSNVTLGELITPEEAKALSSIRAEDGGIAVSQEFRKEVITRLRDRVYIRSRATVIQTRAASVGFPAFEFEGTLPTVLENSDYTVQDITDILGKVAFTPHKHGLIYKVPEELIEDMDFDVLALLADRYAVLAGEIEEAEFLVGTGAGEALGILTAPVTGVDIIGSGTTLSPEDIVGLPYEIRAVYRNNGMYMMPRSVLKQVRLMRDGSGGAGTGNFLWQPSFVAGQPATVNGFPLAESEFFPAAAADGDALMLFGDWSQYWIVDRMDYGVEVLDQLYKAKGQIGYRIRRRYDGAPVMLEAFRRLNRK